MSIKAEWTNEDALSSNEITSTEVRKNLSNIDFDKYEKATTVNPDEVLVIKTDKEYANYIAQSLKDEINIGRPVVVVLRKDMDSYVVKKDSLKIETKSGSNGDFISKEELKEWVKNWYESYRGYHPLDTSNSIPIPKLYEFIDRISTVEVKHSEWVKDESGDYKCKECGFPPYIQHNGLENIAVMHKYCPNCGAMMGSE